MKTQRSSHEFEAIRPRIDLIVHLEGAEPNGHGWLSAEMLTNTDLVQAHVRAHHPDPGEYDEPSADVQSDECFGCLDPGMTHSCDEGSLSVVKVSGDKAPTFGTTDEREEQ